MKRCLASKVVSSGLLDLESRVLRVLRERAPGLWRTNEPVVGPSAQRKQYPLN